MKKIILLLIWMVSFASNSMVGQDLIHIDYKQIEEYVAGHPTEYEALLQRYLANDTLLRTEDFALIYYGYSYTPAYKGSLENLTPFNKLLQAGKHEEAYHMGKELLRENPVSLKLLYEMSLLSKELQKDPVETNSYLFRHSRLLNMLTQSGDGQCEQTAYKVISINDEYQILKVYWKIENILGQSLIKQNYDVLEFKPTEEYKGTKMYFDISRSLEHMKSLFK